MQTALPPKASGRPRKYPLHELDLLRVNAYTVADIPSGSVHSRGKRIGRTFAVRTVGAVRRIYRTA